METCSEYHPYGLPYLVCQMMEAAATSFKNSFTVNSNETGSDLAVKVNEFFKSFSSNFNGTEAGENFGSMSKKFFKAAQENFNLDELTSKASWDILKASAPAMIIQIAMMTAIPLTLHYLFLKAQHNIGRPKLAAEVRYVGRISKAYEKMSNLISDVWKIAKPGLQWTIGSAIFGTYVANLSVILNDLTPLGDIMPLKHPTALAKQFACVLTNLTKFSQPTSCETDYIKPFLITTIALGCLASLYSIRKLAYEKSKQSPLIDPKPIFNKELTANINEITKATYNLQKHGGFFQHLLLYGPGGTGKTMISKIIAKNSNMNYVMMSGGDLAQYIKRGEHVTELNKLFESIANSSSPTILFIDEAESLCRNRDKLEKAELFELLNAFLNLTGEPSKQFMIILTTNRPEDLDPAVLSRMDHKLFVGLPELDERKKILEEYIPRFFTNREKYAFFDQKTINRMSEDTEGLTGRALFKMLNALLSKKSASVNNVLTPAMIQSVVQHFIAQEKKIDLLKENKSAPGLNADALIQLLKAINLLNKNPLAQGGLLPAA